MPDPAAYELAYVEARRALDDQRAVVNDLRSRAGLLIAAAALCTSFFGNAALADGDLGSGGWLAIAAFVALGGCVLAILWPRRDWTSVIDATALIATYVEPHDAAPLDVARVHRDLALHMAAALRARRRQLRALTLEFQLGTMLLLCEVLAWCSALIAQGA